MHVGEAATEANARKTLGEPGLVLLAGHGLNVADHPLESFILCHPDSGNDGRLMAADVYGMPVAADLVGLSACYSGLSSRSPLSGDDLYGLQRAFLQSGANTVVSGLWDVYDETGPELMLGLLGGSGRWRKPRPQPWLLRNGHSSNDCSSAGRCSLLSVGRRGNFPAFSSRPGDAATPARRSADPGPTGE